MSAEVGQFSLPINWERIVRAFDPVFALRRLVLLSQRTGARQQLSRARLPVAFDPSANLCELLQQNRLLCGTDDLVLARVHCIP